MVRAVPTLRPSAATNLFIDRRRRAAPLATGDGERRIHDLLGATWGAERSRGRRGSQRVGNMALEPLPNVRHRFETARRS